MFPPKERLGLYIHFFNEWSEKQRDERTVRFHLRCVQGMLNWKITLLCYSGIFKVWAPLVKHRWDSVHFCVSCVKVTLALSYGHWGFAAEFLMYQLIFWLTYVLETYHWKYLRSECLWILEQIGMYVTSLQGVCYWTLVLLGDVSGSCGFMPLEGKKGTYNSHCILVISFGCLNPLFFHIKLCGWEAIKQVPYLKVRNTELLMELLQMNRIENTAEECRKSWAAVPGVTLSINVISKQACCFKIPLVSHVMLVMWPKQEW